ncbi:hypothetical protein B0A50_05539 [Salinomyces thailandicus]|uniref:Uncharacterized protein n=1 Tax=Salinomyces thailandicus TaxID=706561 RepID=A0A4U0TUY9_9PEZI|nr:hypothetical protein B0A50_05539 [Salinomyces thailandica]
MFYERLFGMGFQAEGGMEGSEGLGGGRGGRTSVARPAGEEGEWEEMGVLEEGEEELSEEELRQMDELDAEAEAEAEEGEMVMSDQLEFEGDMEGAEGAQGGRSALEAAQAAQEAYEEEGDEDAGPRIHPLTLENRYGPSPSTIQLPTSTFTDPVTLLLSGLPPKHISETAHRVFGGVGLPYSTSTPAIGKTLQPKPIQLDAYQSGMSPIEADTYMGVIMPGMLASVMSVLAETRKRLGTAWAEGLVRKAQAGDLKILDAGGGGAGILAVRELLRAEWERMHEADQTSNARAMSLAEASGQTGGASATPPLGTATVLTGSDMLRKRASQLLDNTTFIPRLPDYLHTEEAKQKGKFDLILAPHTLWPLREDYLRRTHTQNLWALLSTAGGVLVLLEKGVPRGFEMIAAARDLLLSTRIASPTSPTLNLDITEPPTPHVLWDGSQTPEPLITSKEKGMIIAPCTNHAGCPLYTQKGHVRGRRDFCHFEQRYIRPGFLQRVLKAKDKNFEDVRFSFVSVMRGRDLRERETPAAAVEAKAEDGGQEAQTVLQGDHATDRAFAGYGTSLPASPTKTSPSHLHPHSLTLPRAILPPLKRRGHVILDLCTPSGTLERWTVPRSFSRQAYRDARKASWGDLWALGAKTRVRRAGRAGKVREGKEGRGGKEMKDGRHVDFEVKVKGRGKEGKGKRRGKGAEGVVGEGGRMRKGSKVGGVREKRDKRGARVEEDD